jgi:hypothetical protein
MTQSSKYVTYDNDIVALLMRHGATRGQAKTIMTDVYKVPMSGCQNPDQRTRLRERQYQMAKWAIAKAKEYGAQNAETTMGHRE